MGTFFRCLIVSLCILMCVFYFDSVYFITWPFNNFDRESLGQFGDSWGALTSIFSVMAFIGVLTTIKIQVESMRKSEELVKSQSESMILQSFENNFFQMLHMLQSIISDMDIKSRDGKEVIYSGRDVFYYFYEKKLKSLAKSPAKSGYSSVRDDDEKRMMGFHFNELYHKRQQDLGHYFRFLYSIFKYIYKGNIPDEQKYVFAKILRAQLSNYELLILFYNATSKYGANFEVYINEYQLFDNLPLHELINVEHVYFFDSQAFGDNPDYEEFDYVYSATLEGMSRHS